MEGPGGDFLQVADSVGDFFNDGGSIGDDEAVKAPLLAEEFVHQVFVHRGRNAFELIEGAHVAAGTGESGLLVRTHISVQDLLAGEVDGVVVTSCLGGAIQGVVLDAGEDFVVGKDIVTALIAIDIGLCDFSAQIRILAGTFHDAAPAGVPADIDHRAEHPVDAVCRGFLGGDAHDFFNHWHIPGRGEGERDGHHGFVAVDDVLAEDERDAGPGFEGDFLELAEAVDICGSVQASQLAGLEHLDVLVVFRHAQGGDETAGGVEVQLTDLLLQGHLGHQFVDVLVHLGLMAAAGHDDQ